MIRPALRGLYVITPTNDRPNPALVESVTQAIKGGASVAQYRDKSNDAQRRLADATALSQLCRQQQVVFLVNDDIALAQAVNADGVHLGQQDVPLADARARLGEHAIIGVTCHDSLAVARNAQEHGADYVAFGRFFTSQTKPEAPGVGIEILPQAKRELHIPIVAIGGITPENGGRLIAAGADMLAVVDGVFGQTDITATAAQFARLFNNAD